MTALNLAMPRAEAGDSGGPDAGRRDPVAGARHQEERSGSREMVPAGRRTGRARSAVPVRPAAARRTFRQEGPAGRLCADGGGRCCRQPVCAVQFRADPDRPGAGSDRHEAGRALLRRGRQGRTCRCAICDGADLCERRRRQEARRCRSAALAGIGGAAELRYRAARPGHLADRRTRRTARSEPTASAG